MPRAALSQDQLENFRETLCLEATRLFAENGYEGVTMRALAKRIGCSPMTPYRYFENKAEIFDTVRTAGADRFAEAIETAVRGHSDHPARLRAMCLAYVQFAITEPHAYRILFELEQGPEQPKHEDLRSWYVMRAAVTEAIEDGSMSGDPNVVAHLLWSGVHGIVALHLSGMLGLGIELEKLLEAFIERELARTQRNPS